jgi:hypothetical protein
MDTKHKWIPKCVGMRALSVACDSIGIDTVADLMWLAYQCSVFRNRCWRRRIVVGESDRTHRSATQHRNGHS